MEEKSKMEKLKKPHFRDEYDSLFLNKINEIVDWITKHDENSKKHEKLINRAMEMREKEHKQNMELTELSKNMLNKIKEI